MRYKSYKEYWQEAYDNIYADCIEQGMDEFLAQDIAMEKAGGLAQDDYETCCDYTYECHRDREMEDELY